MLLLKWSSQQLRSLASRVVQTSSDVIGKLLELPRNTKQALLLALDVVFMLGAMWAGLAIRLGTMDVPLGPAEIACAATATTISAVVFLRLGLYRAVIRFMGQQAIWAVIRGVTISAAVLTAAMFFFMVLPRSLPLFYWAIALVLIGGSRLLVRAWYQSWLYNDSEKVIIYGAGASGRQLATALHQGAQYRAAVFVDDNPNLQGAVINGLQVAVPGDIPALIRRHGISQILLAMPSVSPERRRQIVDSLVGLPVYVRTVPRIQDLVEGRATVSEIQDIELDDLLGREPVPPQRELIDRCITDKVVMVTGAGGSIGSELCRQILTARPRELILLDNSEYALYEIGRQLVQLQRGAKRATPIVSLLGSVQDQIRLAQILRSFRVQTVYHAAAYKHVPLVEHNVAEGVMNNVLGTWRAAVAARDAGTEAFVLISTDKAVRPTNVMGATKRLAEMLLQGLAAAGSNTRFCMVRFGNVLGSSGSVVPLFREQIRYGGPVTVTHPDVTRYFMTIPEAAQLVLQASAMGTGGDVFVLDMGEPVRILDLARRMIRLSGLGIREETQGSEAVDPLAVEIRYIGLRPGEKLHEELLLGSRVSGTDHPMILRAEEDVVPLEELKQWLRELEHLCNTQDCDGIRRVLQRAVSGFEQYDSQHDHLWERLHRDAGVAAAVSKVKTLFPAGKTPGG